MAPIEENGFFLKNWEFIGPGTTYADAPSGYNWKTFPSGVTIREHDDATWVLPSQGIPVPGNQPFAVMPPATVFAYHYVVDIGGQVYDPAYGVRFLTLGAWENAAVSGLYDNTGAFDGDTGNYFGRKRNPGETFVYW